MKFSTKVYIMASVIICAFVAAVAYMGKMHRVPDERWNIENREIVQTLKGCDITHPHGSNRRCGTSVGICSIGIQFCDNGLWLPCTGAVLPRPELCNGMDDDCDGMVDNGFDLQTDHDNCGKCGFDCDPAAVCVAGKCIGK